MSITNVVPRGFSGAPRRTLTIDLRGTWHRFSLRSKLLIVFIVIDLIAALVVGSVTIMRARTSTRVEIAASMALAETLVAETIRLAQQQSSINSLAELLPARQRLMRHVRLSVRNAAHLPVVIGPRPDHAETVREQDRSVPAWFEALIAPPVERRELPIVANEQRIGSVLITGVAEDEIAEAWENFLALTAVGAGLNVAVIALLFILFGRVLAPLTSLARGLSDLERRNYKVRLARPDARELGAIADRFNSLAQALDTLRAENNELNRRLITAQDDERRHTALELHDEVGPCLFGLKANATSIANLADERAPSAGLTERARDMLAIIDHLQGINRSLLNRLRPMALGHVPLGELLSEVVRERASRHPDLKIAFTSSTLQPSYGEPIDLTIYRCVQESLTNAIRHAQATRVDMALGEIGGDGAPHQLLSLQIQDDGCGIGPVAPMGRGLRGMQERVQALSGTCGVECTSGRGTRIRITIPIVSPFPGAGAA